MTEENKQNSSSFIPFSTGWDGKLKCKPEFKEMEETIRQFDRKTIFDHDTEEFKNNYSAHILFRKEYGDNAKKPKRVPNSFLIMKSVVKLIANDKIINCQDGKYLSQMCGLIWKSTTPGRQASSFPHQMNEMTNQLDGMTIIDHQASHQLDDEMDYDDRTFPQQLNETTLQLSENQASIFPDEMRENSLNNTMFIDGISFPESPEPTIAVNCAPLDPNAIQPTPFVGNYHPLNPSSTFENRGMNMQYFEYDNSKMLFFFKGYLF